MSKKGNSPESLVVLLFLLALANTDRAWADSVLVNNPSFEADTLCEGCITPTITGWIASPGGGDGAFNPTATHYPGGMAPDGNNVAYTNLSGNHVHQILVAVLGSDTSYVLEVEVGNRLDIPFAGYIVQLRAGGVTLAEDNSSQSPAPGTFVTATVTYTATSTDPQLGQPLEIWLRSPNIQANFDDVRLNTTTVPVELMSFTIE